MTSIPRPKTPELDRLKVERHRSQEAHDFLEFLKEKGFQVCERIRQFRSLDDDDIAVLLTAQWRDNVVSFRRVGGRHHSIGWLFSLMVERYGGREVTNEDGPPRSISFELPADKVEEAKRVLFGAADAHGYLYTPEESEPFWFPIRTGVDDLLAEYIGVDLKKIDDEKRALLDHVRAQNADS